MAGITKQFPGVKALDSVDLSVAEGEVEALIGENGAGKSTLMKVLGGVHQPDAGTVEVLGETVTIGWGSGSYTRSFRSSTTCLWRPLESLRSSAWSIARPSGRWRTGRWGIWG